MINSFNKEHRFLSNFYPAQVRFNQYGFPTVENAFQAAKCADPELYYKFTDVYPHEAKRLGRRVQIREDWDSIKLDIMLSLVRQKFSNRRLATMLLLTGEHTLVEGNTWGDTFWGVSNGKGENYLGRILMLVRDELRFESIEEQEHYRKYGE